MKPYLSILSARFRMLMQYRAAAAAGFATQLFWGLIRVMIFTAFFESTKAAQPMTLRETVTYVWLGQATLGLMPWSTDPDIRAMVNSGSVAYELTRPLDLYSLWYSRSLANRVAPTVLRSIPLVTIALLFLGLTLPPTPASFAAWVAVMFGAVAVSASISTLNSVILVSILNGDGIMRFTSAMSYALSGMLVPLPLLPPLVFRLVTALPFRDIMDAPLRIYSGNISPESAVLVLAHQAIWTLALVVCGRVLLARTVRNLVIQGG